MKGPDSGFGTRGSRIARRDSALDDLDDDIRDHLERETEENVARGMTLEAARAAARRKFGNIAMTKEDTRAVWIPVWVDQLLQDLRYALRMLRRSPGFSAVVIITLALGIGMNTAVFSVVDAVLLRPLSFAHPDRVVWMGTRDAGNQRPLELVNSQDVLTWRAATTLDRLVAYDVYDGRVAAAGATMPARIATVSGDFWELAGARPELGRLPVDGQPEAMISWAYFERRFAANSDIVGKPAIVGGRRAIIVGVLPRGFHVDLPTPATASLAPAEIDVYYAVVVRGLMNGMMQLFSVVGQLKPGVPIDMARAEIETIRSRTPHIDSMPSPPILRLIPVKEKLVGDARRTLGVLLAAVLLVLVVSCVNIASLLVARASARQREIAIRTAVGAGRGRMLRQFVVESLVLSVAGAVLGLLVARACLQVMVRLIPQALPRLTDAALDRRVLLATLALSVVSAILFGVWPALAASNASGREMLKDGVPTVSAGRRSIRLRTALVAAELALTLVLLCGAGLLVRSLWRLTEYPPGFVPAHTLTLTVQYDTTGIDRQLSDARRREFVREALGRLRVLPGIERVGMTTNGSGRMRLLIEGASGPIGDRPQALHSSVSADYAQAIGMRLLAGRWFAAMEPSAGFVLNESLARSAFPGQDPIGKRIQIDGPPGATAAEGATFAPVIGIVADLKHTKLEGIVEPEIYADFAYASPFSMTFVARVPGDPRVVAPAMRAAVSSVDRTQPVSPVTTVEDVLAESIAPRRFTVFLLGTFAVASLLLALIGIYGVIAYAVSLRTREIGVRMALGAQRAAVVRLIVGQGMSITLMGLAAGTAAAFAATRVMANLLYQVTPTDPPTFAAAIAALALTALAACSVPALKAANVDPMIALRCE
jgi:putative ABC transport system permease protein